MTESVTDRPEPAAPAVAPQAEPTGDPAASPAGDPRAAAVPAPPSVPPSPAAPPAPRRRRPPARVLRAVGRWTAAVTVFGVFCAGTAYGITRMERHEVPGLATASDGRWTYPELTLPALPSGSPRPFAPGNEAEVHHADPRELLVPLPEGAVGAEEAGKGGKGGKAGKDGETEGLPPSKGGWVTIGDYAGLYEEGERDELRQRLADDAVRHIAARGWVMPDGTRTSVHLLRFNSGAVAGDFHTETVYGGLAPGLTLAGAPDSELDESWPPETAPENVEIEVYDEPEPRGDVHTRHAYLLAGDTVALIVQSRKGTAPAVPFRQTVILQAQLLG
ncbi:hypothetical protein [Streptomyces sp. DH37]|uniref:hypothetical protein n=1 Tax=Streptomyces sp. DH37 TaxID=3040122 RepID=UPI00244356EE|nr:hypothetical protein [Streptomyces sp. DH37]MDG9702976.1 hypothetical protein [Streptomyces sp. DH37]